MRTTRAPHFTNPNRARRALQTLITPDYLADGLTIKQDGRLGFLTADTSGGATIQGGPGGTDDGGGGTVVGGGGDGGGDGGGTSTLVIRFYNAFGSPVDVVVNADNTVTFYEADGTPFIVSLTSGALRFYEADGTPFDVATTEV